MLHNIPDSLARERLLEVVNMQLQLMEALCALAPGATVGEDWLCSVWPTIPVHWVSRFWRNDNGNRANWIKNVATASTVDKQTLIEVLREQLRFAELYQDSPTFRLIKFDWPPSTFKAAKELLKSFYDPLFYEGEGFPTPCGVLFHKDYFITGHLPKVIICPYTDNYIQDTKLDHFIPKDQFPMLSCHPDNLIPCSTDANSGSHKGTKVPLDPEQGEQAQNWFHPRWRNAVGKYLLTFAPGPAAQPQVIFQAFVVLDQPRLDNMEKMFGLSEFWGQYLDDEVQGVASDVQGWILEDNRDLDEGTVRDYVLRRARQEQRQIGRSGLAIVKSFFYEHIANAPNLLEQIIRTCEYGRI